MNRIARTLVAIALALAAVEGLVAQTYVTSIRFEGLNAIVLRQRNGASAKEARVVLVNSGFRGNPNPHKMVHVPTIEFKAGSVGERVCDSEPCWRPETPSFTRLDDDDTLWFGWYLFDTTVTLGGSGSVDLTDYAYVLELPQYHGNNAKLGRADDMVWEDTDSFGRVYSRVHLKGGKIETTETEDADVQGAPDELATVVSWRGRVSEVSLSDLTGAQALKIPLIKSTEIRINNYPVGVPHDPDDASHIVEFYWLTTEPTLPFPIKVKRESGANSPEVFCPPVTLGRP